MKKLILTYGNVCLFSILTLAQWSTDPSINNAIALAPGEEAIPKVAIAISGITYVSWFSIENGNYNIRLQKFDVYGNKLWAEGGLLVSDHPSMTWLTDWDMTVDLEDHAILVWQDIRTGNNDVFAYRISPEGLFVWGDDGLQLSSGEAFDVSPKVVVSNAGNAFIVWQADDVIIGQKISPDGNLLWGPNGLTLSGANTYSWPQLLPVDNDDIIMKFFEDSGPYWAPTRHVYAQRFSSSGTTVWPQPVVISNASGISAWTQIFPFINDGNDGFFIAWHDDRDNNTLANMWVQHIGNDGSVLFPANGVEVSTKPNRHHFYAHLALPVGSDDIFIFWNEMDANQNDRGIYGQKVSSAGNRLWTDEGKKFIEISPTNVYPLAGRSTGNDMILFYEEYFNGIEGKIKAMRMDTNGNYIWTPEYKDLCTVQSEKVHTEVSEMNNGQWISVWEDSRNGGRDIYGQNIKLDGSLGPIVAGEVEIYPDTLFFEENPQTLPVHIVNNSSDPYTINFIDEYGQYWMINPFPFLPYTINSGDSLILNVTFEFITDNLLGYFYDQLKIVTETDTTEIVIAINEDLFTGIDKSIDNDLNIAFYPNPFVNQITFEYNCFIEADAELTILNTQGSIILTSGNFNCNAGKNTYHWNGKANTGNTIPPGIYTYRLKLNDRIITGRLVKSVR